MKSLADYRRSLGMTQAQFAALLADAGCPCTQGLVSHWERGAIAITPQRARQIEAATGGALRKEALVFFDGPDWTDRADELLYQFAAGRSIPWARETFLAWARTQGLADPPSSCALGRLLRAATRRGDLVELRTRTISASRKAAVRYVASSEWEAAR